MVSMVIFKVIRLIFKVIVLLAKVLVKVGDDRQGD